MSNYNYTQILISSKPKLINQEKEEEEELVAFYTK
jgi:hypothetical protein